MLGERSDPCNVVFVHIPTDEARKIQRQWTVPESAHGTTAVLNRQHVSTGRDTPARSSAVAFVNPNNVIAFFFQVT